MAAAAFSFGACASDDDYVGASVPTAEVFFPKDNSQEYVLAEGQNSINVEVRRVKKAGALTVAIESSDTTASHYFSIPESVSFADGDSVAYIPVTFTFSNLTPDVSYGIPVKIKNEGITYGEDEVTLVIKYSPWTDWEPLGWEYPSDDIQSFSDWETNGYGAFVENYNSSGEYDYSLIAKGGESALPTYKYSALMNGAYTQPAFVRSSMLNPSNKQLMLYDWFYGVNLVIDYDSIANDLSIEGQYTGYTPSNYGVDVYVYDMNSFNPTRYSKEDYPCTFDEKTGRFTFSLIYYMDGLGGWGGDPNNEYLQLPGYEVVDTTLTLTDGGAYKNGTTMGEIVNFELGTDLGSTKYAVFSGTLSLEQIAEKADAIDYGEVASTTTTESGYKVITVDAEDGYTLVAVLYDKNGDRLSTVESLYFTYTPPVADPTYTAIYQGDYVYSLFFTNEDESPYTDSGLILSQCDDDATKFKISNWGSDVDFTFTMNADGSILVDDQATGYDHPNYGMVMVDDLVDYTGNTNKGQSSYDSSTRTFSFALVYYVSEGVFNYGTETFTITGSAAAKVEKALAAAKAKADLTVKKNAKVKQLKRKAVKSPKQLQVKKLTIR